MSTNPSGKILNESEFLASADLSGQEGHTSTPLTLTALTVKEILKQQAYLPHSERPITLSTLPESFPHTYLLAHCDREWTICPSTIVNTTFTFSISFGSIW